MKYLKLFLLIALVGCFAACSDDEESVNTSDVTVGFEKSELIVKENMGTVKVPIAITGRINGRVSVEIATAESKQNPAKEGEHYRIVDKTLTMLAANDTTAQAKLNIELELLDDEVINDDREFDMTITSIQGGTLSTKTLHVIIRDNDASFYEKFFGKWILKGMEQTANTPKGQYVPFEREVTISGPADESDPDYNKYLTVSAPAFLNLGADLNFTWKYAYTFDKSKKTGTLSLVQGKEVSNFNNKYSWVFLCQNDFTDDWKLTSDNKLPNTITLDGSQVIYLYGGEISANDPGAWALYKFESLTRVVGKK